MELYKITHIIIAMKDETIIKFYPLVVLIFCIGIVACGCKVTKIRFENRLVTLGLMRTEDSHVWMDKDGNYYYCQPGTPYKADVITKIGDKNDN